MNDIEFNEWLYVHGVCTNKPIPCKIVKLLIEDAINESLSAYPDLVKVDDLISFVEKVKDKENRTLADWVVQWILEKIIDGDCKITGSATDHHKKKMYVEFSFYNYEERKEEEDE